MASHDDDHNVHASVISPEHKSSLNHTNLFLEDVVPRKRDGSMTSPSSDYAYDLGTQNGNTIKTKKVLENAPETS